MDVLVEDLLRRVIELENRVGAGVATASSPPAKRYSYQNTGYCYFVIGFKNDRRKGRALCLIPAANNGTVQASDLSFVKELVVDNTNGWVFNAGGLQSNHQAMWFASEPDAGGKYTIRHSPRRNNNNYQESDFINNLYVANADQQQVED